MENLNKSPLVVYVDGLDKTFPKIVTIVLFKDNITNGVVKFSPRVSNSVLKSKIDKLDKWIIKKLTFFINEIDFVEDMESTIYHFIKKNITDEFEKYKSIINDNIKIYYKDIDDTFESNAIKNISYYEKKKINALIEELENV